MNAPATVGVAFRRSTWPARDTGTSCRRQLELLVRRPCLPDPGVPAPHRRAGPITCSTVRTRSTSMRRRTSLSEPRRQAPPRTRQRPRRRAQGEQGFVLPTSAGTNPAREGGSRTSRMVVIGSSSRRRPRRCLGRAGVSFSAASKSRRRSSYRRFAQPPSIERSTPAARCSAPHGRVYNSGYRQQWDRRRRRRARAGHCHQELRRERLVA